MLFKNLFMEPNIKIQFTNVLKPTVPIVTTLFTQELKSVPISEEKYFILGLRCSQTFNLLPARILGFEMPNLHRTFFTEKSNFTDKVCLLRSDKGQKL